MTTLAQILKTSRQDAVLSFQVLHRWKDSDPSRPSLLGTDEGSEVPHWFLDEHTTHPRIIHYTAQSELRLFQPYEARNDTAEWTTYCREDVVPIRVIAQPLQVRFCSRAATLLRDYIPGPPSLFAVLYSDTLVCQDVDKARATRQRLGVCDARHPEHILHPLDDMDGTVLGFFWVSPLWISKQDQLENAPLSKNQDSTVHEDAYLVVITSCALWLVRVVELETGTIVDATVTQSYHKKGPKEFRNVWWEELSYYIVVEVDCGVLLPLSLDPVTFTFAELAPIALDIPRWRPLEKHDVAVFRLYNQTYCFHCDPATGHIRIRDITAWLSTPSDHVAESDLIVDLKSTGQLRLQRVDNIIVIHRPDKAETQLFDVRGHLHGSVSVNHGEILTFAVRLEDEIKNDSFSKTKNSCPSRPSLFMSPKTQPQSVFDCSQYPESWSFDSTNGLVVDHALNIIYRLKLNLNAIVFRCLRNKSEKLMLGVIHFLLQREESRVVLLKLVSWVASRAPQRTSIIFSNLVAAYRRAVDAIVMVETLQLQGETPKTMKERVAFGARTEVFLNTTEHGRPSGSRSDQTGSRRFWNRAVFEKLQNYKGCCRGTCLTEMDFTLHIFYRTVARTVSIPIGKSLFDLALEQPTPAGCGQLVANTADWKKLLRLQYTVLNYANCLYQHGLHPHTLFRAFVFDLCLVFDHESVIQRLFGACGWGECSIILDRLRRLWSVRGSPWALQLALDIAGMMERPFAYVDILLEARQYNEAVEAVEKFGLTDYPLAKILSAVSNDIEKQQQDPDLLPDILGSLKTWMTFAPVGFISASEQGYRCNTQNCQRWFPDLLSTSTHSSKCPDS